MGLLWKFLEPYTDAPSGAGLGQVGWRQHGKGRGSCFSMGSSGILPEHYLGLLWKFLGPYTVAPNGAMLGQVEWQQHEEGWGACFLGVFWEFAKTLLGYFGSF